MQMNIFSSCFSFLHDYLLLLFALPLYSFLFLQRLYRTKAHSLPFTPVDDRVDYITAKQGGEILSDVSIDFLFQSSYIHLLGKGINLGKGNNIW